MAYSYILLARAQEEYESSVTWYAERNLSAAEGFVDAVDHALELICEHPHRWRNECRDYYELGLKKYPFSIVYKIDIGEELIEVSTVYHHSRNPGEKYSM